jgi:hypothetical protein
MKRKVWLCSRLLAPTLLLLLLQAQTCERGDTYLLSLEFEVDGQDLIQGFNANNRTGYAVTMTSSTATATLTVQARMADSTASYQWFVGGMSIEAGEIGLGGGSVLLNVPSGQSQLYVAVRAAEGVVNGYWVDVVSPYPCTEQGILDAIAAGGGPHTFDCPGPASFFNLQHITIDNDVVLDAEGKIELLRAQLTVPFGVTAEIRGFILQNSTGPDEATLTSYGDVTLVDMRFRTGSGGLGSALTNLGGTVTVIDSTFDEPFAYIVNDGFGSMTLIGIYADNDFPVTNVWGTLKVVDSTIAGGVFTDPVVVWNPTTVTNTTILGSIETSTASKIVNSTVDGGISNGSTGTLTIKGTIVETSATGCNATIVSEGYNIESPGNVCGFTDPTDQVNVTPAQVNLGPLQDNGGPTDTYLPGPGSAAIDAIPPADCLRPGGMPLTTDQRGITRPQGTLCDIGAVEVEQP